MRLALWVVATAMLGCGGGLADLADPAAPGDVDAEAAAPLPPAEALEAIHAGEKMHFEVRLAGILAGEASFTTVEVAPRDGVNSAVVTSSIHSAGVAALVKEVRDDATSVIDVDALRPRSTTAEVRANPRDYHAETRFAGGKVEIDFAPTDGPRQHLVYDLGADIAHDAHSAMANLRVWQAPIGTTRTLWVLGGRRLWKVDLTMGGSEVIGTYLGNQQAVRIDGVAGRAHPDKSPDTRKPPRTFSLWMSDDADRVLFKVVAGTELGDVTIDLVDYERR